MLSAKESDDESAPVPRHLEHGFDARHATVAELRSILLACTGEYPTHPGATKSDFIAAYHKQVTPRLNELRAQFFEGSRSLEEVESASSFIQSSLSDQAHENENNAVHKHATTKNVKNIFTSKLKPLPLPLPPQSPQKLLRPPKYTFPRSSNLTPHLPSDSSLRLSGSSTSSSQDETIEAFSIGHRSRTSGSSNASFSSETMSITRDILSRYESSPPNETSSTAEHLPDSKMKRAVYAQVQSPPSNIFETKLDGTHNPSFVEIESDYSDVLDAYEIDSPPRVGKLGEQDETDEGEYDERFSPDPRRRSSTSSVGSSGPLVVQSSGSPLLTKTLKKNLPLEKARRMSLLGTDGPSETRKAKDCGEVSCSSGSILKSVAGINEPESAGTECDHGSNNNRKDDSGNSRRKPSKPRTSATCLFLSVYACILPPLLLLANWYMETGSSIQFCQVHHYKSGNQMDWEKVITARDFMLYIMPSCIPCPKNALCHGNRIVGCLKDNVEVRFTAPKPLVSAFLGSVCPIEMFQRGEKTSHGEVSVQQPLYSRTQSAEYSIPTVAPIIKKEIAQLTELKNTMDVSATILKNAYQQLKVTAAENTQVAVEKAVQLQDTVYKVAVNYVDVVSAKYAATKRRVNEAGSVAGNAAFMHHEKIMTASFWVAATLLPLLFLQWIAHAFYSMRRRGQESRNHAIAEKIADEVLEKMRKRLDKIEALRNERADGRYVDATVRMDQIRDLVFPTMSQRQRRWSRAGDVDLKAAEAQDELMALSSERREKVWNIVRETLVGSEVVEEMEVDGVVMWELN
ncbi:hypothetical protein HDU78_002919 [Chytriomyces hyalinus]|nr:hypothetical protein HDU78_002919 [Chytriomyces hyalinus]